MQDRKTIFGKSSDANSTKNIYELSLVPVTDTQKKHFCSSSLELDSENLEQLQKNLRATVPGKTCWLDDLKVAMYSYIVESSVASEIIHVCQLS